MLLFAFLAVAAGSFNGRWDITVPNEPRNRSWWLEVEGAGTPAIKGKFVGAPGGQLDVIPQIDIEKDELVFTFQRQSGLPPRTGAMRKHTWRAHLDGDQIKGTYTIEDQPQSTLSFIGVRAPEIREKDDGSWKPVRPIELFNGKDLSGWHRRLANREIGWRVDDGLLNNANAGVPDLISDQTFWNFTLHVEYRIGKGSNSGVGLRGRYEVQIFDDFGEPPSAHGNGALYSRIVPKVNASRAPGEWQSFDIRLVGHHVTIVLNDQKVIDNQEIEGLTAIALDPAEAKPGPVILQGDHGPVEFRKIVLTPLER